MAGLLSSIDFSDLPEHCFISPDTIRPQGTVNYPQDTDISQIIAHLKIETPAGNAGHCINNRITLHSPLVINVELYGSDNQFEFGENCSGFWKFRSWGNGSTVKVGKGVTSNGVDCFLNPYSFLTVGDDCMFSMCHIHVGDSHAIFDIQTQAILNSTDHPSVTLHAHVWVGLLASILTDSNIGMGSIVASKAVTTGSYPPYALLAGVPAKIKRLGVSWSRLYNGADREEVTNYLKNLEN